MPVPFTIKSPCFRAWSLINSCGIEMCRLGPLAAAEELWLQIPDVGASV